MAYQNQNLDATMKKVSGLRHAWSKINEYFKSLLETQINLSLLPNKESLHTTMFLNHLATSILSNDANELSGRMKVEK